MRNPELTATINCEVTPVVLKAVEDIMNSIEILY